MKERKVGNITKAFGFTLLGPATAWALSIGDIDLHSALNQNLNAEIRLHLEADEDPNDISVRLATPEKFDRAGIPWSYFLAKIKFETIVRNGSTVIVQLSSADAVTEPFLDVLLEINDKHGNQYKEFPLLMDPPLSYEQPQSALADNSAYRVNPISESTETTYRKSQTVAKHSLHHHAVVPNQTRGTSVASSDNQKPTTAFNGEFGPTKSSDNLWQIAKKLGNERGISPNQMMSALYHANPSAFVGNNMNALKLGVILNIPVVDGNHERNIDADKKTTVTKQSAVSGKPLELLSPADPNLADKALGGGSGKDSQAANNQADDVEAGKSADAKSLELQGRIEKLEQQLGLMQQLLALKDQQLSEIQNAQKSAAPNTPSILAAVPAPVVKTDPSTEVKPEAVSTAASPTPVLTLPAAAPKPLPAIPAAPPIKHEDFFGSETYYLTLAGVGVGLLSILGWLWSRKRSVDLQTNRESMFATADQIRIPDIENSLSIPVLDMENSAAFYDVGMVGESSFMSDFTPSDFDSFDGDHSEVDPLSEADVYLAYGRYQQAEDLIRHAIKQEPEKDVYKLKLLEVFYAGENRQGFTDYVQELAAKGKQADRVFWSKVTEMAQEIVADLPLFGGVSGFTSQLVTAEPNFTSDPAIKSIDSYDFTTHTIDFPDSDLLESVDQYNPELNNSILTRSQHDSGAAITFASQGLDFDSSTVFDVNEQDIKQLEENIDLDGYDFDVNDLSFNETSENFTSAEASHKSLDEFDFNFEIENLNTLSDKPYPELDLQHEQVLDGEDDYFADNNSLDKHDIDLENNLELKEDKNLAEFDFSFNFDIPVAESREYNNYELSVADLTDTDEFETKIDLAKAYIDMGDAETAKMIAEEVLIKGSSQQQHIARTLLDEIK